MHQHMFNDLISSIFTVWCKMLNIEMPCTSALLFKLFNVSDNKVVVNGAVPLETTGQ